MTGKTLLHQRTVYPDARYEGVLVLRYRLTVHTWSSSEGAPRHFQSSERILVRQSRMPVLDDTTRPSRATQPRWRVYGFRSGPRNIQGPKHTRALELELAEASHPEGSHRGKTKMRGLHRTIGRSACWVENLKDGLVSCVGTIRDCLGPLYSRYKCDS